MRLVRVPRRSKSQAKQLPKNVLQMLRPLLFATLVATSNLHGVFCMIRKRMKKMKSKHSQLVLFFFAGAMFLSACKPADKGAEVTGATNSASTTLKFQALNVGQKINTDQSVAAQTMFKPDDKIIASVQTNDAAKDVLISAKLIAMSNGQVLADMSRKVTTTGSSYTNFEFPKAGSWTLGRYQTEASINGKFQARQEIEVRQDGPPRPPSDKPVSEKKPVQ